MLHATYTERGERIRIISAGRSDMSKTTIIAGMRREDGLAKVVEVLLDSTKRPFPDTPMQPLTEAEVTAAARDPDAPPFPLEELAAAKRIPGAKTLRRALGLTQEEFAARYRIPLGILRD
jgi:putative transcriptional regulator